MLLVVPMIALHLAGAGNGISRQSSTIKEVLTKKIGSSARGLVVDFILIALFIFEK